MEGRRCSRREWWETIAGGTEGGGGGGTGARFSRKIRSQEEKRERVN